MGDAENVLPPSKKRAAGRELSRDNPGLDDDEEEILGQETGTFKRATDEVLANRRIVKVRRGQTPTPSSNPFASIQLIPPTNSTPTPTTDNLQEPEKTAPEDKESPSSVNKKTEAPSCNPFASIQLVPPTNSTPTPTPTPTPTADNVQEPGKTAPEDVESPKEKDEVKNPDSETEKNPVSSFGQLSSSQNAFTGLAGTGFSTSTFSFGSLPKTDTPTFPSFSFGTNGNSSLFGTPSNKTTEGIKIPSMQEVHVETGEENEKPVFTADSALFEFLDGGWKERGKGEVKVNVPTTGKGKARLVMRARGNYRLILNASIFPDMKLTNMEKKGITFACLNSTGDGKDGLSTFALKFKDASIVDEFRSVVMEHKGDNKAGVTLKTPENSP